MNIADYLRDRQISVADFARTLGISHEGVRLIVLGKRKAGAELAQKIQAATDGAVTLADLRPDLAAAFGASEKAA